MATATTTVPIPSTKPHPSASLYVGDLQPTVTEGMLFELFSQIGPLASIRVCRDTLTRRSLGYAYVNFHGVVDAERALDTLNNHPIKGRPCRIMWSQRDPSIRKSGIGNIFIKNLDTSIGHKELFDTFSAFGNILSCKVAMDENGNSKGFAFVHFESEDAAVKAIDTVNDKLLASKKVFVGKFQPKKERRKQKDSSWTNVYIKDLDLSVSEEDLQSKFSPFGTITSCIVMRKEGVSLGFGFVNFDRHESARTAVENLLHAQINGKTIWCGRAQKRAERMNELALKFKQHKIEQFNKFQGINLYIKNLEDEIDEDRLKKEFAGFGSIRSAKIMDDGHGNSKGFGFICFTSADEAQQAINDMNGHILSGCSKPLYVALHEPKDIRRQKLAQRHAPQRNKIRPSANVPLPPPVYSAPYYSTATPTQFYAPQNLQRQQQVPQRSAWTHPPAQAHAGQSYPIPTNPGYNNMSNNRRGGRVGAPGRSQRPNNNNNRRTQVPSTQDVPIHMPPQDITLIQLAAYPPEQQKLLLGERLYPMIHKTQPQLAGKITGMLLDSNWSIDELYSLLNDEEKLNGKIDEAVTVLNRAGNTEQANVSQ